MNPMPTPRPPSPAGRHLPDDVTLHDGPVLTEDEYHLHGKAISGHRHAHRLRPGESRDDPDHVHHDEDLDGPWVYPEEFPSKDDWLRWLMTHHSEHPADVPREE